VRRLALLLLPLLVPLDAAAQQRNAPRGQDAFCAALTQLAGAAGSGFDYLPRGQQLIPGSVNERRGIAARGSGGGPPRAAFFAVMMRDESRQRPNPVVPRFEQLRQQITRCLPDAVANPVTLGQGGAVTSWTLQMAIIGLRRDDGEGAASTAEVELSVQSRW
jgi:hypothetical protein